jgi:hypothetical protein
MKTLLKTMLIGAVLAVAGVATATAAADAVAGSWTLNAAKSTVDGGPGPKSETRTYAVDKDGTTLSVTGVAADGSAVSEQSTWKYDGKAYPLTGAAEFDALSLKRVNGTTTKATLMKGGKKVGTTTRTISGHGKVMTLSTKVTGADGKAHNIVLVYDKQ